MAACGVTAVCGEVVESVLAFLRLQMRLFKWPEVRISNVITVRCLHNQTRELCCQFEASATDLREFNMDEKRFLSELYRNSRYLSHAVSRSCKSSIKLISQANGRNGSCIELHICTPEPIVVESLGNTPAGCKSEGFQLSFFLHVGEATLLSETKNFLSCLHLLHIVNPDVVLSLQSPTTTSPSQLEGTTEAVEICIEQESYQTIGAFRVASSTERYTPSNPPQFSTKMHFVRGSAHHLHGNHGDLKLYCCAATTPSIKNRKSKVRANQLCSAIHVSRKLLSPIHSSRYTYLDCSPTISVFGPTCAPIGHWACPLSDIASLAQWSDYGLKVSRHKTHDESGASFAMEVTDCDAEHTRSTQTCASGVLHLLVFLECKAPLHVASDWDHWVYITKSAIELEQNFSSLLVRYKAKFQQATHSALSKILYNYKMCGKTSVMTTMAIQEVSEAVASIIRHSTRNELRTMCVQQLQQQAFNGTNFSWETHIRDKLWSVATQMGLVAPSSDMNVFSLQDPYLDVEIALSAHSYQNEDSPLISDASLEQVAEYDSEPVYAHAGLVSTASVQSTTRSPVEWAQHAVTHLMGPREHADSFKRLTEAGCIDFIPGQMQGQSGQMQGQSGQMQGQSGQMQGQSGQMQGQSGQIQGQSGERQDTMLLTGTDEGSTKASCVEGGLGQQEITRLWEDWSDTGSDGRGISVAGDEEDSGDEEVFSNGSKDFSDDCEEDFSGHESERIFSDTGNKEDSSGTEYKEGFEEDNFSTGDEEELCSIGDELDFSDEEGLGVNGNCIGDNFSDECRNSSNDDDVDLRSKHNHSTINDLCMNAECENSPTADSTVAMHTNVIHRQRSSPAHSALVPPQCEPCSPMNAAQDSDAEWDSLDTSLST